MRTREGEAFLAGGYRVHARRWLPDGEPAAIAVLVHGLAEHSGRYETLAARLVARGFAVHSYDQRGHGRTGGARSNIGRFTDLVADAAACIEHARLEHPAGPVLLLGHSMGGAVALATALAHPSLIDRLVLSAPAVGADPAVPKLQVLVGHLLSRIAPSVGILRLDAALVSRDPVVVRAYEADPLVFHGSLPARTLVELLGAMKRLHRDAPALRMPVLVLHGTDDRLVPLAFTEPVYARLASLDRTVICYEGFYHEVFNEPGRERVFADLEAWLDRRMPGVSG
jgi:alpha-beta hydrolase superfamily lysophospholipase